MQKRWDTQLVASLASTIVGVGVCVVLVFVSPWFGVPIGIGLIVFGIWLFLRAYMLKGRVAKTKRGVKTSLPLWLRWWVGTSLLVLTIIASIVLGLSNMGIHQQANAPTTTPPSSTPMTTPSLPQGLQLSHPNPQEISDYINSLYPYQKEEARKDYEGLSVTWAVSLVNITIVPDGEHIYSHSLDRTSRCLDVVFTIDINDYPKLRTMEEGQEFIVQGTITSITGDLWITLDNCRLFFY
jgi:hypothetical protein